MKGGGGGMILTGNDARQPSGDTWLRSWKAFARTVARMAMDSGLRW